MDATKYRPRGYHAMSSGNKRLPYALLLLLAVGAAALGAVVLNKLRERRVFAFLLQERDQQLVSLQLLLQKEKEFNEDVKMKVEELKAKTSALRIQRAELKNKLMESETTVSYLKNTQKELEAALTEKENHANQMQDKAEDSGADQMTALMELLHQKEAELEEMKSRLQELNKPDSQNATSDVMVLEKPANSSDAMPDAAEEESSVDEAVSTEGRHQEVDSSSEEQQWVKFTTNMEYDGLQEKIGDAGENSDNANNATGEDHPEDGKLADGRKVSQEELDDKAVVVTEAEKEVSTDGKPEISKDGLTEDNNTTQAVEETADPANAKPDVPRNDNEAKQTNTRHRKRRSRSRRKKKADVAAANVDEGIKKSEVDGTVNAVL